MQEIKMFDNEEETLRIQLEQTLNSARELVSRKQAWFDKIRENWKEPQVSQARPS